MMEFAPRRLPASLVAGYVRDGAWTDESAGEFLATALARNATKTITVLRRTATERATLGDVLDGARRLAGGLRARGIGPGDAVAFQLPNRVDAAVAMCGISMTGAAAVPIVTFYGVHEVRHILTQAKVRAVVADAGAVQIARDGTLDELTRELSHVETLVVTNRVGERDTWRELLTGPPIDPVAGLDPDSPALVAYTSGTTAPEPKGVVHSHRTIGAEVRQLAAVQPDEPAPLIGAPLGHAIGMLGALLVPLRLDRAVRLVDGWNPKAVLAAMLEQRAPAGTGSPYFLHSLLDHPDFDAAHRALVKYVGLGGAPVPAETVERCEALGISVVRMYGATEHPSVTGAAHHESAARRGRTDGHPLAGVEVRLVDDDGADVGPGMRGEVLTRGPDASLGYLDPALTAEHFDAEGWFHTGDIGEFDDAGWLAIVGRKKDLIICGGENISPVEIESLLETCSGVAEAAVVGMPDRAAGELVCAFVRAVPGEDAPDVRSVHRHLRGCGLAAQKWPTVVRVVDEMPRTVSGKIAKHRLRELAVQLSGAPR